eukprot:s3742_g5.t5
MSYRPEEVDQIILRLEKNVERQIATVNSAVKGVAAERDLLSTAEASRDLLLKAVAGEKDYLDKVFGGSCERIGRFRHCLDPVKPNVAALEWMVPRHKRHFQLLRAAKLLIALAVFRASRCFVPARRPSTRARLQISHAEDGISPSTSLHRPQHQLGDVVEVRCEDDGMWYQAVVEHETADGNFMVRFDRDGYEYHYPLTAWRVRLPRASSLVAFQDLPDGTLLNATITQINQTGARASVQLPQGGTPYPGYITKANMGRFVVRVEDVLSLEQEVCVKVISTENDRLSLALNDSLDLSYFEGLGNETWIDAKVEVVAPFGVFLKVPCPKAEAVTGLLSVSEMADFFVADPNDLVSVGDELLVRVIGTREGKLVVSAKPIEIEADLAPFHAVAGRDQFLSGSVQAVPPYGAYVMVQPPSGGIACRGFVMKSDMELTGQAPEVLVMHGIRLRSFDRRL